MKATSTESSNQADVTMYGLKVGNDTYSNDVNQYGLYSKTKGRKSNYGYYNAVYGEAESGYHTFGVRGVASDGYLNYGTHGSAISSRGTNYGVYGSATGANTTNYGVYGIASNGSTNWGIYSNGKAGGTTAWSNSSDARLKKDVQTLEGALDKVLKLRGVSFYWKNRTEMAEVKGVNAENFDYGYDDQKHIGVIAQELEEEFPELVGTDGDGFKSVEYSTLAPILIEAMKEQQQQIETLKNDKAELQSQIDELKRMVEELMNK
jgi:hypothetical protein